MLAVLLGLLALTAAFAYDIFVGGWVLSVLWGWFAVPFLHVPTLSVLMATGLMFLVRYVTDGPSQSADDPKFSAEVNGYIKIGNSVIRPFVYLFVGYVVHCLM